MKNAQRSSFKLNPIAAAIAMALASQFAGNAALAGSGFGSGMTTANTPVTVPTYYAHSPSGPVPTLVAGQPTIAQSMTIRSDGSQLPVTATTGTLLRKFVDTLPGFGAAKANNLGQYIPVAVGEKWANPLIIDPNTKAPLVTADDYYEIAAVEFTEKLHSDLPKATRLRGYVQLETPGNAATSKHIALTYPNGSPILDAKGVQVLAYDNPHHLGPVITATKGTAVRVKFTNYLPVGGKLFLPVDTTLTGAGVGPDGVTKYTENRAGMHLVGGQAPWISAGSPHQWVAPAGEAAAYAAGLGKGATAQTLPDMTDPGAGSTYLYFPNDLSARFTFIQDRTTGLTRLNAYAGLEAAYVVTDPTELSLIANKIIPDANATIPLIIEDKTFVPANIAQQDAKWDTVNWGATGDLWFPHVYEPNQDPSMSAGGNPVGRWDYGPRFWPIFPVTPAKAALPTVSSVPEAYMDTPLVNGTAYPTLTVEPKAYRLRILNASNDRYINLGLYKADPTATLAPKLDQNGNPIVTAAGVQQFLANTEVKMVPASGDAAGNPPGWDAVAGVQTPLPQFPVFPWNINAEPSGPTRAWPVDGRAGGAPDPASSGPDFVVIGNDGGLLPQAVDIPPQPVTYEQNRRSITVLNIYGYGLLLGPAERADTIVDFSNFAGQTLILYNDAPAPTPFNDPRNDYYTGDPDLSTTGGAYTTQPGYGPNTRTIMQIVVGSTVTPGSGGPLNAATLAAALPAAYAAAQPRPLVPESAYNAAFGTADGDNYGHVATGSAAQPNLIFAPSGAGVIALTPGPMSLITSGGAGTGSGSGYLSPPTVVITPTNGVVTTPATAHATVSATGQVASVILDTAGAGYTALPNVTFVPTSTVSGIVVADGGSGYSAADQVVFSGGGGSGATATLTVSTGSPILSAPTVTAIGSGYTTNPSVSFTGGGGTGAAAIGLINTSGIAAAVGVTNGGSGYTAATQATVSPPNAAMVPNAVAGQPPVASTQAVVTPTVAYGITNAFTVTTPGANYDQPTTATTPGGGTTVVNFVGGTQPFGGALPTATANLDPSTGAVLSITLLTPGSGYTTPPTPTVTDVNGNTSAVIAPAALAATGAIAGVAVATAGTGYTSAPTISFTTGSGAQTTTTLVNSVGTGTLAGLFISNVGSGYTTAPTVKITDVNNNASATATVAIAQSAGTITGIKVTNPGKGYTSAPSISFSGPTVNGQVTPTAGVGALATANIAAAGVGAQATVVAANTASIPVLTKAEQELFDDYGRYNSTGGVELPLTLVGIQTTVPLSYIDAPTEIIGDKEVQIWKLVDNGLWSNSIHFSMADVQLINRVGWDGTVKAPASNEVGWKDTLRLNPLEDVLVAVRAKQASVPFGQPQSTRLQDPSTPAGSVSPPAAPAAPLPGVKYASNIGFMVDPGVVTQSGLMANAPIGPIAVPTQLLATSANTNVLAGSPTHNFDNEFTWGSAILGHAENDLTRPVVFNPTVTAPDSSVLADPLGTGTLNWTDPTPTSTPATTLANPKNEIGYKLLQAATKYSAAAGAWEVDGAFTPIGSPFLSLPANVTQYIEPVANLAPTTPATGPFFAYQVAGYNVAGSSLSNIAIEAPPNAPAGLGLATAQSIQLPATTTDVQLTATWTDNAVNETNYIVTRTGPSATLPVTGTGTVLPALPPNLNPGSTTTTFVDPTLLTEGSYYKYDVIARNSFGDSKAVLSGTVQAPYYAPNPPTNLAQTLPVVPFSPCPVDAVTGKLVPTQCQPDSVVLTWTDAAINETRYDVSRDGVLLGTVAGTAAGNSGTTLSFTDTTAAEGVNYKYTVAAVNAAGSAPASLTPVTVAATVPTIPTNVKILPSPAVDPVTGVYVDTATVSWSDNAYNENAYAVIRDGVQVGANQPSGAANNPLGTATAGWKSSPVLPYTDLDLATGSTHTWQVQALNALAPNLTLGGTTSLSTSAPVTFTMPGLLMTAPTNLRAVPNRAGSSIGLSWTDNSNNETDFLIEEQLSTDSGLTFGAWSILGTVPRAGGQTTGVGGLVNFARANVPTTVGYVYNFRVRARNLANKSDSHPYLTVQASLGQPATPLAPTLSSVTQAPAGGAGGLRVGRVTLTWTPVAPAAGTTVAYLVFANGVQIARIAAAGTAAPATTFNYRPTLAQELAGITYTVETVQTAIRVANPTMFGSATSLPSNAITLKATAPAAPAAPAGLAATVAAATGAVTLNWTAVTPAAGTTITYLVSVGGGAGVPATRGAVFPLAVGSSYSVSVAAVATTLGLSTTSLAYSAPITVDLTAAATPVAPATLTVNATTLNWAAATGVSAGATVTYTVQQSINGGAWTTLTATPIAARTLAVASPIGSNYQYQVAAQATRFGLATSAPSAWRTTTFNTAPAASTLPTAALTATPRNLSFSWTNASSNITGFTIQRRLGAGAWATIAPAPTVTKTGNVYSIVDVVTAAGSYTYRVTATSLGGTTAQATSNAIVTP